MTGVSKCGWEIQNETTSATPSVQPDGSPVPQVAQKWSRPVFNISRHRAVTCRSNAPAAGVQLSFGDLSSFPILGGVVLTDLNGLQLCMDSPHAIAGAWKPLLLRISCLLAGVALL